MTFTRVASTFSTIFYNDANKKSEAELNQLCQAFLFNLQFIKGMKDFDSDPFWQILIILIAYIIIVIAHCTRFRVSVPHFSCLGGRIYKRVNSKLRCLALAQFSRPANSPLFPHATMANVQREKNAFVAFPAAFPGASSLFHTAVYPITAGRQHLRILALLFTLPL